MSEQKKNLISEKITLSQNKIINKKEISELLLENKEVDSK